jgi:hypothetical protein
VDVRAHLGREVAEVVERHAHREHPIREVQKSVPESVMGKSKRPAKTNLAQLAGWHFIE